MSHSTETPPFLVDLEGFYAERTIEGGWPERRMKLLYYRDGTIRFQHLCDRGERGIIVCAPALQPEHRHEPPVEHPYPDVPHGRNIALGPTIVPSILCSDCGTHGFVNAGRWADA